jgi:pimeloyl-ACP methyl ester carboxylesterase
MTTPAFDEIYARVPVEQKDLLQRFRTGHPYKELDVGGVSWRYIACGQGDKALLFIPGGFLAADMWFYSILALEHTYHIVAPDSYTLQGTFELDGVCSALVQILDAERIKKATIIGLSAGGGVAQYFLQEHPERVEHVVFSHCGILERDPEAQKALKRLLTLARLLPLWIIRRIVLQRTAGDLPTTSPWIEFHNAFFQEAASRFTKEMFLRFLQSGAEARQRFVPNPDVVESWRGEILILGSRDDEMAVRSLEKLQAHYPRARTHLFEEGGHHTFMLFPETYTATLSAFLEKELNSHHLEKKDG